MSAVVKAAPDGTFVPVARVEEIPAGWVLKVKIGTRDVAVANCDGELSAVDNSCPHAGGPLGDSRLKQGCVVECSWHGSAFDVRSGEILTGPARKPVKTYPVLVEDGTVLVRLE